MMGIVRGPGGAYGGFTQGVSPGCETPGRCLLISVGISSPLISLIG